MSPSLPGGALAPRAGRGRYFFLSYAHSAPPTEEMSTDTDHWVRVFYRDLADEVRRWAQPSAGLGGGFFDDLLKPGSDWNAVLGDALGAAEVFVALYSPGYFSKSWPMREREAFLRRLRESDAVADKQRHVLPVLWIPMFSWETTPEVREALALGADVAEYVENGMRALCMLPSYRPPYRKLLVRIAQWIVDVAENSPVGPSWAPPIDEVSGTFEIDTPFVVGVFAGTVGSLPPDRDPGTYGAEQAHWRPFADGQALPLTAYVVNTAERLGLPARIGAYPDERQLIASCPAVLLIDPWVAADARSMAGLRAAVAGLPGWVMPLVVVDKSDPQFDERGADLARDVTDMLLASGVSRVRAVQEMEQFVHLMPSLVTEARRRYLKLGPAFPPKVPSVDGPAQGTPRSTPSRLPRKQSDD